MNRRAVLAMAGVTVVLAGGVGLAFWAFSPTRRALHFEPGLPAAARLVKVTEVSDRDGVSDYRLVLALRNETAAPVWLVLPRRGQEKLPPRALFGAGEVRLRRFDGREGGAAIEVALDAESRGFRAFRLPPGAHVRLDRWELPSTLPPERIEVWQSEAIVVNGETPIEQWLERDALSSQQVRFGADLFPVPIGAEPPPRAESISIRSPRPFSVPVEGIDPADPDEAS